VLVSNSGPEKEARSHPRYAVRNFVSYCYGNDRFLTATFDLGLGGMKIQTYHFLPEDEELDIRLVLGPNSVWLKGQSVYSQLLSQGRYTSGLRFIKVSEQDRNLLKDFLATLKDWLSPRNIQCKKAEDALQ